MWEFISKLDLLGKTSLLVACLYLIASINLTVFLIRNRKLLGPLRILTVIVIASLIQTLLTGLTPKEIPNWYDTILEASPSAYTLLEFSSLQFVFYRIIKGKVLKKLILFFAIISMISLIIFAVDYYYYLDQYFSQLTLLTSTIMLLLSFIGYHQIVNADVIIDLNKSYQFWFITAVFFFFSISLPLYFFNDYFLKKYPTENTSILLTNIGITYYILFFLLLHKASICKAKYQK